MPVLVRLLPLVFRLDLLAAAPLAPVERFALPRLVAALLWLAPAFFVVFLRRLGLAFVPVTASLIPLAAL